MNLTELLKSKEYQEASGKIGAWKEKLAKADQQEVIRIRDEKVDFFKKMRTSNPELYVVFQLDDKTLSEQIYKKLTGKDIVID